MVCEELSAPDARDTLAVETFHRARGRHFGLELKYIKASQGRCLALQVCFWGEGKDFGPKIVLKRTDIALR